MRLMFRYIQLRDTTALLAGFTAIALVAMALRWFPDVSTTTVALALLLVVLGAATVARLRIAIVVAVAAMLTFNFFFLPPLGAFIIADPQNWIALFAFFLVGVIASKLSAAAQTRALLAERETAELIRQKADLAATLLASISHDVRTPLTAISVAVENLRRELPHEERRAQATAASTELERLTRLFQDILDMARIDSAAIRIDREWVSASDVVDAALAHVRHALDGHALRVDAAMETEVEIDPRLTSGALSHILENAAQYSPSDREIVVIAHVDPDGLHVSVSDEGPGLDPGELEHLFERFYRGRSARQLAFGTGMGLAITRGLLAAAGGRVWAENVPGRGARFSIVVPGAVRAAAVTS
jgi:two-component system sensor histidine kinase KdpD